MIRFKRAFLVSFIFLAATTLSACSFLDVVGNTSIISFGNLLEQLGDRVSTNESQSHWVITSPSGDTFEWSKDFSASSQDVKVTFDATPFIAAGLDISKLPGNLYSFDSSTNTLSMTYELSEDPFTYSNEPSPLDTYKEIVQTNRELIGYHAELDHFGISLGNENMFEWAKDLTKNDKDMVFVLNPEPFIKAGTDPSKVESWVYGKVKASDEKGKMIEKDKLLKPFNLG